MCPIQHETVAEIMAHPSPVVKRTAGTAHLHLLACLNTPEKQFVASTVARVFPTERRPRDYIHHSWDTCGLEWQKTFADPGQWSVGQRELPVLFMYISGTGVVSAPDNMSTHQQAHFQVTSPHMSRIMTCSWQIGWVPERRNLFKNIVHTIQ